MNTIKELLGVRKEQGAIIIGAGSSIKEYEKKIDTFIKKENLFIIGVNNMTAFWTPDYHVWTNNQRFRTYGKNIKPESTLLLGTNISLKVVSHIIGSRPYIPLYREDREGISIDYKDGKVYGTGNNKHGQLGNGKSGKGEVEKRFIPIIVDGTIL